MIAPAIRTTTPSAPSSKACALQMKKARCIGSPKCCMPAKTFASSRGVSSSSPVKTSAWLIRKPFRSRSRRNKPSNSSACRKREFPSPMPRPTCAGPRRAAKPTMRSMKRRKRSRWNKHNAFPNISRTSISQLIRTGRGDRAGRAAFDLVDLRGNKKGRTLRSAPFLSTSSFSLAFALRNYFVQFENRQEHGDDDSAHDDAEKTDQQRFDQRRKRIQHGFDFFVPEIGHFFEHSVDLTGCFTCGHHSQ